MTAGDTIALISLIVAVAACLVALVAIRTSNRNSAAATLLALNEAFHHAWNRFLNEDPEKPQEKEREFGHILNLCETACAFYLEGSLAAKSKMLSEEYLSQIFTIMMQVE